MNEKTILCTSCGAPLDYSSGRCLYCAPYTASHEKPCNIVRQASSGPVRTGHGAWHQTKVRTKPGIMERLLSAESQVRFMRLITASRIAGMIIACGIMLYLFLTRRIDMETRIIEYLPDPGGRYKTAVSAGNLAIQSAVVTLALVFAIRPIITGWKFVPYLLKNLGRTILVSSLVLGMSWFAGIIIYYGLSIGIGIMFVILPMIFTGIKPGDSLCIGAHVVYILYFITVISMTGMASQYCDDRRTWIT